MVARSTRLDDLCSRMADGQSQSRHFELDVSVSLRLLRLDLLILAIYLCGTP